ncbi:hypothetical protein CAPTEDRAFT_179061 [Capitella teleta]|uniref:Elongator complex protein 2 n=1 Tax=Capitella teleta TaxID=283909 RepID=R7TWN9_CAPTE|nr:hypothetical protein CAPTEDRAFT_179061 [Capitella teleta]|eukprot:ELT98174.1 hypothetical protein CAPTEDRAFT_179061 [Capitella teleta]
MSSVKSLYISSACNKSPHCVDWGRNGLIIYGTCNAIAVGQLQNPSTHVSHTLCGHSAPVNSVRWIRPSDNGDETEFVSSSSDKTAIVWDIGTKEKTAVLSGHTAKVSLATGLYLGSRTLIATTSVDSTVKIWQRKSSAQADFQCIYTISFGSGFAFDLSWVVLPNTQVPMLACCGDDQKIHLYIEQDTKFIEVHRLCGHEDWIRAVEFAVDDSGDVMLASCDQEFYIRIWRISSRNPSEVKLISEEKKNSLEKLDPELEIKMTEETFALSDNDLCYAVTLESVLHGHENWIYSLHWQPAVEIKLEGLILLSASMDQTLSLWAPDPHTALWLQQVRVGEVGGNNLGFYGAIFSPSGRSMLAHGYQGAFHVWHQQENETDWKAGVTFGGHFSSVRDLCWDPEGAYLISTGTDQTTRLHAYWHSSDPQENAWHEMVRPQVHGYDLQCLSMVNRFSFASGADEKVIRVFQAPRNFLENFSVLTNINFNAEMLDDFPEGASVPALGLSNKAVFSADVPETKSPASNQHYPDIYFSPQHMKQPPTEENLMQNTLWPETQKLYGHGYEVFALACHPKGTLLASACKAAKADHACIILWDTKTWRQSAQLSAHSLTVTHLSFSHNGRYLLSVSRDRNWCLFQETAGSGDSASVPSYERVAIKSAHSRIIWSCAWSHDDQYFVTVSRDKKAVVWQQQPLNDELFVSAGSPLKLPDSVTAVDFAPDMHNDFYILAFGLDNGHIMIYKWADQAWSLHFHLKQSEAHHLTVKQVKFQPTAAGNELLLASCSDDHSVKINSVKL